MRGSRINFLLFLFVCVIFVLKFCGATSVKKQKIKKHRYNNESEPEYYKGSVFKGRNKAHDVSDEDVAHFLHIPDELNKSDLSILQTFIKPDETDEKFFTEISDEELYNQHPVDSTMPSSEVLPSEFSLSSSESLPPKSDSLPSHPLGGENGLSVNGYSVESNKPLATGIRRHELETLLTSRASPEAEKYILNKDVLNVFSQYILHGIDEKQAFEKICDIINEIRKSENKEPLPLEHIYTAFQEIKEQWTRVNSENSDTKTTWVDVVNKLGETAGAITNHIVLHLNSSTTSTTTTSSPSHLEYLEVPLEPQSNTKGSTKSSSSSGWPFWIWIIIFVVLSIVISGVLYFFFRD